MMESNQTSFIRFDKTQLLWDRALSLNARLEHSVALLACGLWGGKSVLQEVGEVGC